MSLECRRAQLDEQCPRCRPLPAKQRSRQTGSQATDWMQMSHCHPCSRYPRSPDSIDVSALLTPSLRLGFEKRAMMAQRFPIVVELPAQLSEASDDRSPITSSTARSSSRYQADRFLFLFVFCLSKMLSRAASMRNGLAFVCRSEGTRLVAHSQTVVSHERRCRVLLRALASTSANTRQQTTDRYEGKVVVVTGGSRGIGAGIVRAFHQAGGIVVYAGLLQHSALGQQLQSELNSSRSDSALFVECDITDSKSMDSLINSTVSKYGRCVAKHSRSSPSPAYTPQSANVALGLLCRVCSFAGWIAW